MSAGAWRAALAGCIAAGTLLIAHPVARAEDRPKPAGRLSFSVNLDKRCFTNREPLELKVSVSLYGQGPVSVYGLDDLANWSVTFCEAGDVEKWRARFLGKPKARPAAPLVFPQNRAEHVMNLTLDPADFEFESCAEPGSPRRKSLPTGVYRMNLEFTPAAPPPDALKDGGPVWRDRMATGGLPVRFFAERFEKAAVALPEGDGERETILPALPVDEAGQIGLADWYRISFKADPALTYADSVWVLLRGAALDENDRMWIDSIKKTGGGFVIHAIEACWTGEGDAKKRFRPYFAVNVGQVPGGECNVEWHIARARFTQPKFDERDLPLDYNPLNEREDVVTAAFKVAREPAAERADIDRPKDWPTSTVPVDQVAARAVAVVRAKVIRKDEKDPDRKENPCEGYIWLNDEDGNAGSVTWMFCVQSVNVLEVLAGRWQPGEQKIKYCYFLDTTIPIWPKAQKPLAAGAAVIVYIAPGGWAYKILPDSEWNRREAAQLFERRANRARVPEKQEPGK